MPFEQNLKPEETEVVCCVDPWGRKIPDGGNRMFKTPEADVCWAF